jgi:hypothetical protein
LGIELLLARGCVAFGRRRLLRANSSLLGEKNGDGESDPDEPAVEQTSSTHLGDP